MRFKMFAVLAALAVTGTMASAADAAPRRRVARVEPAPLTINKRSYLEPSNQVPVGSRNDYVVESTYLGAAFAARDLVHNFSGETALPDRFFAPNWTGPQFGPVDFGYRLGRGY